MRTPWPIVGFCLLAALGFGVVAVALLLVITLGEWPFVVVVGGGLGLLLVHFWMLLAGLRRPRPDRYFDHVLTGAAIVGGAALLEPSLCAPWLVGFLWVAFRPDTRGWFGLPPLPWRMLRVPVPVVLASAILVGFLWRVFAISPTGFSSLITVPLAGEPRGLLLPLTGGGGAILLATLLALSVGGWIGWRITYWPLLAGVLYLYLLFVPIGLWLGCGLAIAWVGTENRQHFGLTGPPWRTVVPGLLLLGCFVGIGQGSLPAGTCRRHGDFLFLHRVAESPLVKLKLGRRTIYSDDELDRLTGRVRLSCPHCEAAVVFRAELHACRERVASVAAAVARAVGAGGLKPVGVAGFGEDLADPGLQTASINTETGAQAVVLAPDDGAPTDASSGWALTWEFSRIGSATVPADAGAFPAGAGLHRWLETVVPTECPFGARLRAASVPVGLPARITVRHLGSGSVAVECSVCREYAW